MREDALSDHQPSLPPSILTQPQPHQRPQGGAAPVPDGFNPAELQWLLELRERGPISDVVPSIDFAVANHPSDLTIVLDQVLKKAGTGISILALLSAASWLLTHVISSSAELLEQPDGGTVLEGRPGGAVVQSLTDERRAGLRAIMARVVAADDALNSMLSPMLGHWIETTSPAAMGDAKAGNFSELQRALISDAVLEALQIDRADLDLAASGPGVDS